VKIKRGSTSVRRLIFVADSSSTTGAGLANLVFNTASLVGYYFAGDLSNEVSITLATATLGTWASGGFIAVDNTNMPGWYEIGIPDAALDGGNEVAIQLHGAANMVPVNIYIELDAFDYQTATQPVNVTQISGDSVAADNAEAFFDGNGYAGTNNVMPTVTTLTNLPTIPANWLTAAGLAADAVTEIQAGLATPTNITAATGITLAAVTHTGAVIPTVTTVTSGLDAAGVRTAIGLAVANLDTQLADLPTVAEFEARSLPAASYFVVGDYTQPPSASTISSQVAADLAVAHGVGAWTTATGFSTLSQADIRTAVGLTTANLDTQISNIQSDTNDIQTRLPAALESGRIAAALDSAARVKLDGTQPDYAPLKASDYTAPANSDITAIKAKTDNLPSDPADQSLIVAATDAILTAVGDVPTNAELTAALGTGTWATALPWNAAWDAEVQSEVQDAIEVNNLDHLVKIAVDTNFATTVHLNSVIGHMADNGTTATFSRTTDSLEAIRDNQAAGSGASLPDIIAGVQSVSGAIIEAQNSATLSIRIGDTWTQDVESLGDLTDKTVCFALKKRASDADTAAIVFIVEGTGLTRLNGATTTAGWGSITILDEVAGDIRLRLESNATALLTSGSYVDAVKVLEDGDDRSPRNAGRTVVSAGVIADIT
jgi:hypothetical protein